MGKITIEEMKECISQYVDAAGSPDKAYHDVVDGKTDEEIEKVYKQIFEDK